MRLFLGKRLLCTLSAAVFTLGCITERVSADHPVHHAFPGPTILIDAGHGGIDGGTSYGDILEKNINLEIGRRLFLILRSYGYSTVLNRTGDYALSDDNRWLASRSRHLRDLAQRKELSTELTPSIVVSLHVNWSKSPAKRGPLILFQEEGKSVFLATCLQDSLNQLYKTKTIPIVGEPFYILNYTPAPTVIVEMGFISNAQDRNFLTSLQGQRKIANTIAEGIIRYFTVL
ncbi:N-acetylmuramoyl-L-alanine amidase [Paenibacillus sp. CAA11]|uniref:N-acetylmuramoyl-L-alanine amidase family protein n=1 Tax=Paenibacillus sp. CAA11 TaxID=1532905 RepID=UPI000D336C35|nr:N-acetylmuramoyl-L-alanine amidase [Paenibacillus sp. CAA11]AWB44192.1 N-acetylmuramoyl-L-alanine amidase [Paenibacillus sp. CAA11]